MKAAQLKIVSLTQAELNAAIATKNAASEGTDEQRFYAACDRVDLEPAAAGHAGQDGPGESHQAVGHRPGGHPGWADGVRAVR